MPAGWCPAGSLNQPCFVSRMKVLGGKSLVEPPAHIAPLTHTGLSSTGMCLQAFVEAFFYLAQRKFKMLPLHEQVASLIDLCEYHLSLLDEKRLVCGQSGTSGGRPPHSGTPQEAASTAQLTESHGPPCTNSAHKLSRSRHALS